jgi:hypothetical protein
MKTLRSTVTALLFSSMVVLMSCGESSLTAPATPTAVKVAPQADLLGVLTNPLQKLGLLSCSPLPAVSATQTIGPAGGVLRVGPHTLTVPAGALHEWVTITAVSPSDRVNRIHFEPHGLEFEKPASLTMSYANCNLLGILLPKHIAYTDDNLKILYYLLSVDNLLQKKVTGQVNHFSEYAAAW